MYQFYGQINALQPTHPTFGVMRLVP